MADPWSAADTPRIAVEVCLLARTREARSRNPCNRPIIGLVIVVDGRASYQFQQIRESRFLG